MKFIHCADLHLASPLDSRLTPEQTEKRRNELLTTFIRIADYAVNCGVAAVLISGDVFDEKKPYRRDKRIFLNTVRNHPETDFICLSGNHDENLAGEENLPVNLRLFGEEVSKFSYDGVDIWGCELNDENCGIIYTTLRPDADKTNIVMLHGQIVDSQVKPTAGTVVLPLLRDKGIDYLALGHIHSYSEGTLDRRGRWCYPGCPEGRGYDECGEKGFVLLDVEEKCVQSRFVPFACRTIIERSVELTGITGEIDAEKRVLEALSDVSSENLVRIYLTGRIDLTLQIREKELESVLSDRFFSASVKNKTGPIIDTDAFTDELSLKGEFIRTVMAANELSEADKEQVIRCGLLALMGEEVEFG